MSSLILESILQTIGSLSDGSIKITLHTQEMDSETAGKLFHFRGKYIKCLLNDDNITTLEEELVESTKLVGGKKQKSESQRLRAVLFRYHEQSNSELDFETWYKQEMNIIIEHFKSKLD